MQPQSNQGTLTRFPLFLGAKTVLRPDWPKYLKPPAATRSTKPESQAKEIADKQAARQAGANELPFAATVVEVEIFDAAGEKAFISNGSPPFGVATDTLAWLGSQAGQGEAWLNNHRTRYVDQPWLFALNAKELLRILVADAIAANPPLTFPVPHGYWMRRALAPAPWVDPRDIMIPHEMRNDMGDAELMRFLNAAPGMPVPTLGSPSLVQASWLREFCVRCKLAQ